jgi:hypothetical protein
LLGNDREISKLSNGFKTTAVARKWFRSNRVIIPTDTKATTALQQRNDVFYAVRADTL